LAAKDSASPSEIDKTSFFWTGMCAICHPGGGPGELDRDGYPYYDFAAKKFGYELADRQSSKYDGDYTVLDPQTGQHGVARWDITGVSEPDCMLCHRADRAVTGGKNMNWIWRAATLRGGKGLVDADNESVPAYAAAATAGQGWHSRMDFAQVPPGSPPKAAVLQIDYAKGLDDGSIVEDEFGRLLVSGHAITKSPKDQACWGCHATPDLKKRGRTWFSGDTDVHYAHFNKLHDSDPDNDVAPGDSRTCVRCHPAGMDHNFAKGGAFLGSVQNETDYRNFRTCADCHLGESPDRDPEAKRPLRPIHTFVAHQDKLSCQACHVPARGTPADLVIDNAVTGITVTFPTSVFLSADPLDPTSNDKTAWYPAFKWKKDEDGKQRLYPVKRLLSIWWGDWDTKNTATKADDVISPIALWRVRQITGGQPLAVVTDDNGDGKPEVNRPAEILAYIKALKNRDTYGTPVAVRPVLIKGGEVYFEDPNEPDGVGHFEYEHSGIKTESSHPFSVDHNVQPTSRALGAGGCTDCHAEQGKSPVFDRMILVDPYGPDGKPVYKTVEQLVGARAKQL